MKDHLNKKNIINAFTEEFEPFRKHEKGKKDLRVYLIENHSQKDELLRQQLIHIHNGANEFYVMVEKELYDLIPEYYSEEALFIQSTFFRKVSRDNVIRMMLYGMGFGIITMIVCSFFMVMLTASLVGVIGALFFMIIYLNTFFQKQLRSSRMELRQNLINEFTEKRLDEIIDTIDRYTERRFKELDEEDIVKKEEELESKFGNDDDIDNNQ